MSLRGFIKEDFRTRLQMPAQSGPRLTHSSRVLMAGSCFTDEVGRRLCADMFDVVHNPTGEQYNPLSVAMTVERILDGRTFGPDELLKDPAGVWHCMALHSRFSSVDPQKVLTRANAALARAGEMLGGEGDKILMLTFGTAHCYRLKESGEVVSNCHKLPSGLFDCRRLSTGEITDVWRRLMRKLQAQVKNLSVVFTVSPVRYLSYGPHGNTLSKATLHLAAEQLCDEFGAEYFPAFEMLCDDLRDYRFYAPDMVHPSAEAADYVYGSLLNWMCDADTLDLARRCRSLMKRAAHRPLTDNPAAIEAFREATRNEIDQLIESRPCLKPRRERFFNQISNDL